MLLGFLYLDFLSLSLHVKQLFDIPIQRPVNDVTLISKFKFQRAMSHKPIKTKTETKRCRVEGKVNERENSFQR